MFMHIERSLKFYFRGFGDFVVIDLRVGFDSGKLLNDSNYSH